MNVRRLHENSNYFSHSLSFTSTLNSLRFYCRKHPARFQHQNSRSFTKITKLSFNAKRNKFFRRLRRRQHCATRCMIDAKYVTQVGTLYGINYFSRISSRFAATNEFCTSTLREISISTIWSQYCRV